MHLHPLSFAYNDRARLHQLYKTLMAHLEKGEGLQLSYFVEIKQTMQSLLLGQKGLQHFWKAVQKEPSDYHHLHITHKDKALLNLPWQIAVNEEEYPAVYISKGVPAAQPPAVYQPQAGPLRVLVMIASPEDLDYSERLSYEEEEQVILKALAPLWETGQVQVDFTEDGSLQSLQAQLQLQHYHILYFSGHGIYKEDTGWLRLENAVTLQSEYITAQQLARSVNEKPAHTPALVILSSCQTAQGDRKEGFRGIADELVHMGVPAVIAMASSIIDHYNIVFAGHLYNHLANRLPLAEAHAKALLAMKQEEQQQLVQAGRHQYCPSQWLVPQLYCSREVSSIVNWQAAGQVLKVAAAKFIGGEEFLLLPSGRNYYFIGRRRENALLFSRLLQNKPVLLTGQGGVGKTALAEHLVKRLITQDPARYCFAFNETGTGISDMIARLRQYFEKDGRLDGIEQELRRKENALEQLDFLLQELSRFCKPVWVFDNMETFQQEPGDPLKEEYNGWIHYVQQHILHRFPVIFTGRYPIHELDDAFTISLNQVSFVDFYRKCLQLGFRTIQQENNLAGLVNTASLLYDMFGGSYRTLEFFDEIYKNDPTRVQELLRQMRSLQHRQAPGKELMQKMHDKLANDGKKIVFSALLAVLNEQELTTLHLLAHFHRPVLLKALNMQQEHNNFEADLQRLQNLTLIEVHEQQVKKAGADTHRFYYITPLVRDWIDDIILPTVFFYPEYAGDYFIYTADKITGSYSDLETAFLYYEKSRELNKINDTGAALTNVYFRLGLHDLVLYYGKRAEAIAGNRTQEDIFNNLGLTYLQYRKFDTALSYLTRFLIAARIKGDKENEAMALNSISQVYFKQEDYESALSWLQKSRQLAKENQLHESEAMALTNIGNIYAGREQYDNALEIFGQSLHIRQTTGNRHGEARILNRMGEVYSYRGETRKAILSLQKSLAIINETADRQLEGTVLNNIGQVYQRAEEHEQALRYYKKGLSVCEETGDNEGIGAALTGIGLVHKVLENYDEAVEYLAKGSVMLQKMGHDDLDAGISGHLGNILVVRGDYEQALPLLLESLPAIRKNKNLPMEAAALDDIGVAYHGLGEYDKAIQYLEESLSLKKSLGDKAGEIELLDKIGQACAAKDDYDRALSGHTGKKRKAGAKKKR